MNKESIETTKLGFWIYLMTDLTMFAGLFALFAPWSPQAVKIVATHRAIKIKKILFISILLKIDV